jgi:hypothetical protein
MLAPFHNLFSIANKTSLLMEYGATANIGNGKEKRRGSSGCTRA